VSRVRQVQQMPNWVVGLIAVVLIAVASIIAFSGLLGMRLPWQGGYEVKAVFASAQNVSRDAPVRIAGVNVGKVTGVEPLSAGEAEKYKAQVDEDGEAPAASQPEEGAIVTMELDEKALPLKTDATFKLRPRLFLEGNNFIDLQPGSPNAEEIEEGHTFPVNRTSYSVQLDQVLTTLQSDVRKNLQVFLDQFGSALTEHGGAEGFRELYRTSGPAGKYTSQVSEAFLGTEDGDLGGVIRGLGRVVRGLGRNEAALQNLVGDFSTVSGSFAAEDVALAKSIERLPGVLESADPAFASLNAAFPPVRAFAREALPGVQSAAGALDDATPFIAQLRGLMTQAELRGLSADLRPTIPALAKLTDRTIPFLREARALSSCFNEVIIPWANDHVEAVNDGDVYPHDKGDRVFETAGYVLTGLTGLARNGDANGQWGRVLGQSGQNILDFGDQFALIPYEFLGGMPAMGSSKKTVFTAEHDCEKQEPPSLQSGPGPGPAEAGVDVTRVPKSALSAISDKAAGALDRLGERVKALSRVPELRAEGEKEEAKEITQRARKALKRLGLGSGFEALALGAKR